MSDWLEQYSAALDVRDAREQAHKQYIDAYTRLADRTAAAAQTQSQPQPAPSAPSSPLPPSRTSTPTRGKQPLPPDQNESLSQLRADLAANQKARQALQTDVATLTATVSAFQIQQKSSTAQITLLTRQKTDAERKLRDREEEIREKGKLATDAQDEMVALQLQLNMAEQRSEKLERENKELVDRWMKRMGEEAERVNRDSRWE